MSISPKTFNGHDIQSTTYISRLDIADTPYTRTERIDLIEVPGGIPSFAGSQVLARPFVVRIQLSSGASDINSAQQTLQQWFAPGTEGALIVDFDGTDRALDCRVASPLSMDGNSIEFSARLIAADPWWRSATYVDETNTLTASGETLEFTAGGNAKDRKPVIVLTQNSQKTATNGQQHLYEVLIVNRAERALSRYPVLLAFDHAAEVTAGRSNSDGSDVRIFVRGKDTPYEILTASGKGWNQSTTTICFYVDAATRQTATLYDDIEAGVPADGGDLEVDPGTTDGMPSTGRLVNPSSGECISYSGITKRNSNGREAFTGIVRGARNTTAASATDGDTLYLDDLDVVMLTGWSGATAPDAHPELATHLDMSSSNLANTRWVFASYLDETYPGRAPAIRRMPPSALDNLYQNILIAGGSPLTTVVQDYDPDGAQAGEPNHNIWEIELPTGTAASGTLDFTRVLGATLALVIEGLNGDGLWSPVSTIVGPQSSGSAGITLPAFSLYRCQFRARAQVIWSPSANAASVGETNFVTANAAYQAFTAQSDGVWTKTSCQITHASGVGTTTLTIYTDDGSGGVGTTTGITSTHDESHGAGSAEWVTFDHTDVTIYAGQTYWIGLSSSGSGSARLHYTSGIHPRGPAENASGALAVHHFVRFISSDADPDTSADATDGDQVTVTALDIPLNSATVPYVSMQTREDDVYQYQNAIVRHEQSGREVRLNDVIVRTSDQLSITFQPGAGRVENITRGERPQAGVTFSDPNVGLEVEPGTNTYTYEETGVASLDMRVRRYNRWE